MGFCAGVGLVNKKLHFPESPPYMALSQGQYYRNLFGDLEGGTATTPQHLLCGKKVRLATQSFLPLLSNLSNYYQFYSLFLKPSNFYRPGKYDRQPSTWLLE